MMGDKLKVYENLEQGSDEWLDARLGIITASEIKRLLVTRKGSFETFCRDIASERAAGFPEENYVSFDMMRGKEDEVEARIIYEEKIKEVKEVGFMRRDFGGFTLGYSPDGLVGDDGLIEIKSRKQKFQFETALNAKVPEEYIAQIQCGLMVSGRAWCDFISVCFGMEMIVIRVFPDAEYQQNLKEKALLAEAEIQRQLEMYRKNISEKKFISIKTEQREKEGDIIV